MHESYITENEYISFEWDVCFGILFIVVLHIIIARHQLERKPAVFTCQPV